MTELGFYLIASVTIASAFWVVASTRIIHSAVALLFTLFGVAGLYVFLYADFLAATQIVIYVGGILVLIIFGVMLTNKIDTPVIVSDSSNKIIGLFVSAFIFSMLSITVLQTQWNINPDTSQGPSTVKLIGHLILGKYLLPFELISVLLLAALAGSAMLARKKIDDKPPVVEVSEKDVNQEEEIVIENSLEKEQSDKVDDEENLNG